MSNGLWQRLRGARGIELFAALAIAALVALMLIGGGTGGDAREGTDLEARLEKMLSRIDGAGRVSVMIAQDAQGEVTGALIIADGLEDVGTYLCLQRAVMALVDVQPERIDIVGRDGSFGGTM